MRTLFTSCATLRYILKIRDLYNLSISANVANVAEATKTQEKQILSISRNYEKE